MTLGVAVVGAGRWGPNHVRNLLAMPRCQLRWVCDLAAAARQEIEQRFPSTPTTPHLDQVLADGAVQAVVIAAPATAHAALAHACLQAGKHVLVEKPLCTRRSDADALVMAAAAARRTLHVGHLCVHEPGVQRIQRLIADGALGSLRLVDTDRTSRPTPDVDVGVLWDLAVHDISIANTWIGAAPVRAAASGTGRAAVNATLHYPGGALARIRVSWLGPARVRRAVAIGDRGAAAFDALDRARPVSLDLGSGTTWLDDVDNGEPLRAELDCFLDAIERGTPAPTAGQAGADVVAALTALDCSLAGGGAVVDL